MPYVDEFSRKKLDKHIDALAKVLHGDTGQFDEGEMNYAITRLLTSHNASLRYREINRMVGVLQCTMLELYRRIAAPYEDAKKKQNGDVY